MITGHFIPHWKTERRECAGLSAAGVCAAVAGGDRRRRRSAALPGLPLLHILEHVDRRKMNEEGGALI